MKQQIKSTPIKILSILLLCIGINLTLGCSNDTISSSKVDNSELYGSYEVHKKTSLNQLEIFAQLRIGGPSGTTLSLTNGSTIKYNDITLTKQEGNLLNARLGTFYATTLSADLIPETHTFLWTTNDGLEYTNTINLPNEFSITHPSTSTSHSKQNPLDISTTPTKNSIEEIYLYQISGTSSSEGLRTHLTSSSQISTENLNEFKSGSITLSVISTISKTPQQGHAKKGGTIISKISREVSFQLTD